MRKPCLRAIAGFTWGLLLFLAIAWALKLSLAGTRAAGATGAQLVLKLSLSLVALAVWRGLGRPYREMGWRRAKLWDRAHLPCYGIAAIIMMGTAAIMILLGVKHPLASQMSFLEVVLVIWGLSSASEEIYVRGLVQSWAADGDGASSGKEGQAPPVVISALLFAAMHVPLLWSPVGIRGGLPIVLATLGVGHCCAVLRARSGSLWPATICHVIGNIAGVPGALLGVGLYRVLYGRLPEILTNGG